MIRQKTYRGFYGRLFPAQLSPTVRMNMMTELWGSVAYGIFFAAALQFFPVVLRRMGASSELLALYTALTYLGSILTAFSLVLMRRRRTKTFAVWCWYGARSLFLLYAIISNVDWMLIVAALFWLLEAFPAPAYTRIMQAIYPQGVRGHVMSIVRLGMVVAILCVTPFAGWALDEWGYRVLFPLAAVAGLFATMMFNRLEVDEGALPPRDTRSVESLWSLVRRDRRFALYLASFSIYGTGALIGYALYPIVQVDRLQLSYTQLGWLGLAQSFFWLLGFLVWGQAVDRLGGTWVLRSNLLIAVLVPFSYIFATSGWMLLPAFIAQGIISAGIDLGLINACIQLAKQEKIVEYAAIQSTVVGLRGMIAPFIGVLLLKVGFSDVAIFGIGTGLILLSWWIIGFVEIPRSREEMRVRRQKLRFRWPVRYRSPKL